MSAALEAIKDGQLIGKFHQAIAEKTLEERVAALEQKFERIVGHGEFPDDSKFHMVVVEIVAARFGLEPKNIFGRQRPEHIVWPRHICMWLLRNNTPWSLKRIGDAFGRDHGSVHHAMGSVADRMSTQPHIEKLLNELDAQVKEAFKPEEKAV